MSEKHNLDDKVEAMIPEKGRTAVKRITSNVDNLASKPRNLADHFHNAVYASLKEDESAKSYFTKDDQGNFKRIEGPEGSKLQRSISEKLIDTAYERFKKEKGYSEISKDDYKKNFMPNDIGMNETEILNIAKSLNSLDEDHFKRQVSQPIGQSALRQEISLMITDLASIKDNADEKSTYVTGLNYLQNELKRFAKMTDYQGNLEQIKDITDAQQQFQQILGTAISITTQKKETSGYATPRKYASEPAAHH